MTSRIVKMPEPKHHCGPDRWGMWADHPKAEKGTVVQCDCGRTWVSAGYPTFGHGSVLYGSLWYPEGRLRRWWRERRQAR